ncbi:MAG: hypothetical protein WBC19_09180 [Pyrinomonadaceae bacterium]
MTEKAKTPIQSEFEALPLDQKISQLMKMEVVTLTESFNYVVKSATKAFEQAGDAIQDFGAKVEAEAKKATSSTTSQTKTAAPKATAAKPKARPAKKPSAKK